MDGTITLAIETSNPSATSEGGAIGPGPGVAVGVEEAGAARVLDVELLNPSGRHDDALMPAVERVCARLGLRPQDLARIAVSCGPGGFTGVRIAAATAALLCEATGASCVPVPTASVVAARREASGAGADEAVAVGLASKRGTVWVQAFVPGREPGPGAVIDAGGVARLVASAGVRALIADAFLPQAVREASERAGARVLAPCFDPAACFEASLGLPPVDPGSLRVIYPREPEAVTVWRERRG